MFPWIDRGDKERGHGEDERKRKKERKREKGGSQRILTYLGLAPQDTPMWNILAAHFLSSLSFPIVCFV